MSTGDLTTTDDSEVQNELAPLDRQQTDLAQARIDSVSALLDGAYKRASQLVLTDDERKSLLAAFPDEAVSFGAKGNANLAYLDHAIIRGRMFEVFGPGAWSLVCRRYWTEEYKTSKGLAVRVYADCVMIVRGCYVGEAMGAGSFFPNNPQQDYSDAAEAAQSEALRRIAAKSLGIGLQLWSKGYTEALAARKRGGTQQRQPEPEPQNGNGGPREEVNADTVQSWREWAEKWPTVEACNKQYAAMQKGNQATRDAVWNLLLPMLARDGIVFDPAAKRFGKQKPNDGKPVNLDADPIGEPERDL